MSYYKLLGLEKEPFSTNPDPNFLYLSREYDLAFTNILIELRLKRGLSVILGDVGTGKTTLSRRLVQELSAKDDFIFHMVLDPTFATENEFLACLIRNFQVPISDDVMSQGIPGMRDAFEKYLFQKNMSEKKTVILLIDEAQKLSYDTLESLRVLLNYETNEFKLIQLVIFGQMELYSKLVTLSNFFDRIDFKFTLNPLGLEEVIELIKFRLERAGYMGREKLFETDAIREIHYYTKGYPRGVIRICHKCLRTLAVSKTDMYVTREMALRVMQKELDAKWDKVTIPQKKSF